MADKSSQFADIELSEDELKVLRDEGPAVSEEQNNGQAAQPVDGAETLSSEGMAESGAVDAVPPAEGGDVREPARDEKGKFTRQVPLPELIEERKARQAVEKEFAEFRGRTQATLDAILQRQQSLAKPAEQPKPLDVDADPVGALKATRDELAQIKQEQQLGQQYTQFRGHVSLQEQAFRKSAPDYDQALDYARQSRIQELLVQGYNEISAQDQLNRDEFQFCATAVQNGRNPAEALYQYATARGYKKATPAPEKPVQTQSEPSALEKLATIETGQRASKSLGGTTGAAGNAPLTIERLAQEFTAEQIGKLTDEEFRRLMGG